MTAPTSIWRLKIALVDLSPSIWRRVDVDPNMTLSELHVVIQAAMGWDMMHLYEFHAATGAQFASSVSLRTVVQPGGSLLYIYDFGDYWRHRIDVEEERPSGKVPRCIAGKNACPPEDCGGPGGYADLVRTLAKRGGARRRDLLEWLGGPFDPRHFTIGEANERIAEFQAADEPSGGA